ncbi:hypothetical protein H5P28_18505 [Ruficoccus amylovorans]|uniref:Uncharacterized protein n=1 Tax=Ruficoccus amylovorans TaxID=1804625 RepID=A0A842HHP3_9BACT|nr:hypothetical protein [Ruficoccus amylovorans]MBC2596265.1 hypothetical protein [Ruficoccus amylovorans]
MDDVNIPPLLLRRLKFRAHRRHTSVASELAECLQVGMDSLIRREERFRQTAPRLRQKSTGFLGRGQLEALIEEGRA